MTFRRGFAYPRQHDNTHSPVGLWQLNGDLTDESGNALTLTNCSGTDRYITIGGGIKGYHFDGASAVCRASTDAVLRILGDMTIEMLCRINKLDAADYLISHNEIGELEADNTLYGINFPSSIGGLSYIAEKNAGTNIVHTIDDALDLGVLYHIAMVRDSNQITFYIDGEQAGATSVGLDAPTGGTEGQLALGATNQGSDNRISATLASVKIIGSALTAAQVRAEYQRTLG